MEVEKWKPVKGYEGMYEVSNLGNVRSLYKGIVRKPNLINSGYFTVRLAKGGKQKTHLIHRLVAEAFLEKPPGCDEVNHKDYNKLNNRADNLEWITHQSNCDYSAMRRRENLKKRKPLSSSGERNIEITPYGRYRPHVSIGGKNKYFGCYKTMEEAIEARDEMEGMLWPSYTAFSQTI